MSRIRNNEYNYISIPYFPFLFNPIVSIPLFAKIKNRILHLFIIFDWIYSIPYLTRIRNKEWSNVFISYSLFFKIDVTLERRLRKLHVFMGTAAVFTLIIYNSITQQLATLRESLLLPYSHCISNCFYSLFAQNEE